MHKAIYVVASTTAIFAFFLIECIDGFAAHKTIAVSLWADRVGELAAWAFTIVRVFPHHLEARELCFRRIVEQVRKVILRNESTASWFNRRWRNVLRGFAQGTLHGQDAQWRRRNIEEGASITSPTIGKCVRKGIIDERAQEIADLSFVDFDHQIL
jgi:hypothetical protein